MKLYIAGKMTGDPDYKQKFDSAAAELEAAGYIVLKPAWQPDGLTQAEYMRIALVMLDIADEAVFLQDWKDSEGAKVERAYCQKVGKRINEWMDLRNCNFCKNISVTEEDQHAAEGMPDHICRKYGKRVYHNSQTPGFHGKIYPCAECKEGWK